MVRMDIQTVVVGGGPVTSLVVLRPRSPQANESAPRLPIRIGPIEAMSISMGVDSSSQGRPMTHDLLLDTITSLGAHLDDIEIVGVEGTTFFARLVATTELGRRVSVDARPSDAIALAVRAHVPIFADEAVVEKAAMPDFGSVERDERQVEIERFHDFVESLSPEDFD